MPRPGAGRVDDALLCPDEHFFFFEKKIKRHDGSLNMFGRRSHTGDNQTEIYLGEIYKHILSGYKKHIFIQMLISWTNIVCNFDFYSSYHRSNKYKISVRFQREWTIKKKKVNIEKIYICLNKNKKKHVNLHFHMHI